MRFHVPGTPEPLRRHRAANRGGRVQTFDDPRNGVYADRIRWAWRDNGGVTFGTDPVALRVTCHFPRPKGHLRSDGTLNAAGLRAAPPGKGDVDNLAKAVMDALNGLAWADDRQIIRLEASKWWALPGSDLVGVDVEAASVAGALVVRP